VSLLIERLAAKLTTSESVPPDDGRRRAAVAALLHDDRVLLMKRTERTGDPWSGHVSLPGGRHDPRDPDLLATAIRETREELGIDLAGARLSRSDGTHRAADPPASSDAVRVRDHRCGSIHAEHEAEAALAPLELARSGSIDDSYTYPGSGMTFPSWRTEGYIIWGLTCGSSATFAAATG
jgi:8-oxo-dGTP pyrophosphatase MutT (NUDIX family)